MTFIPLVKHPSQNFAAGFVARSLFLARVTRPVIVLEIKLIQRTMALETSLVVQIVCNL